MIDRVVGWVAVYVDGPIVNVVASGQNVVYMVVIVVTCTELCAGLALLAVMKADPEMKPVLGEPPTVGDAKVELGNANGAEADANVELVSGTLVLRGTTVAPLLPTIEEAWLEFGDPNGTETEADAELSCEIPVL